MTLDLDLLADARAALGTSTTTGTIHRALEEVVALHARRKLAAWDLDGLTLEALDELRRPRSFIE